MRFISWNVNGLRACLGKGFLDFFKTVNADCFCLQETKMQPDQLALDLPGYRQYWHSAEKNYSARLRCTISCIIVLRQQILLSAARLCSDMRFSTIRMYCRQSRCG